MFSYLQNNFFQKRFVSEVISSSDLYDKLQMLNYNKLDKNQISKAQNEFQLKLASIIEQSIESNQYSVINDLILNLSKNITEIYKINNIQMTFYNIKDLSKETHFLLELLKNKVNCVSESCDYDKLVEGYNFLYKEFLLKLDDTDFGTMTRILDASVVHQMFQDFYKIFINFESSSKNFEEDKSTFYENIDGVFLEVLTKLNCKNMTIEEEASVVELSNFKDLVYINLVMMLIKVNLNTETVINDDLKKRFNIILSNKEFIKTIHPLVYFDISLLELLLQLKSVEEFSLKSEVLNLKEMIKLHKEMKLYKSFSNCSYEIQILENNFLKSLANLILIKIFSEQGSLEGNNTKMLMTSLEINPKDYNVSEKVICSMFNIEYSNNISIRFNDYLMNKVKSLKPLKNNFSIDFKSLY